MSSRKIYRGYFALRYAVLKRDKFTCQYCGQKAPDVKLEVDHVVPVEDGGEDIMENLKTSCWACNKGKASLSIISHRRKNQISPIVSPIFDDSQDGLKASGKTGILLNILNNTEQFIPCKKLAAMVGTTPGTINVMKSRLKRYGLLNNMVS